MTFRCDCYMAWDKYKLLPEFVPINDGDCVVFGFWMKTKDKAAFEALGHADFDEGEENVCVVGRDASGKVFSFTTRPAYYPYSGQWNGYSPFSFLDKEVVIPHGMLARFLEDVDGLRVDDTAGWRSIFKKYENEPEEADEASSDDKWRCVVL